MARLLNEAMDAGACGWSTQTLGTPGDPAAVTQGGSAQSDFDGTPMPSDVMWPETHEVLARVLGERGEGFIEMSAAGMPREHWERIAELSGAPVIYQAMPASPYMMEMHDDLMAWFERCRDKGLRIYGQGITQNPPLVFTFDYWDIWGPVWTEFTGPDLDKATKLANMADPAVREKLRSTPLKYMFIAGVNEVTIVETFSADQQRWVGKSIQEIADATGKHGRRRDLRPRRRGRPPDDLRGRPVRHQHRRPAPADRESVRHPGALRRRSPSEIPRSR